MADPLISAPLPRRTSSQTSSSSHKSQKAKACRPKQTTKRHSGISVVSSNAASGIPADLTSFPSLSPDSSPRELHVQPDLDGAFSQMALQEQTEEENGRAVKRGRQAALERLTSSLSQGSDRPALFDDSFSTSEVPGALHLADSAHIEHLLERSGAVKLVRQFARDLAIRDAEISKLRRRADARERELKRMLRDVGVSSQDIERRLYDLENPPSKEGLDEDKDGINKIVPKPSIGGLMGQAMEDPVGEFDSDNADLQATLRPFRNDSDAKSGTSSNESGTQRRPGTVRIWQDYILGSINSSHRTSRASSVVTDPDDTEEITPRASNAATSGRRKGLDERLFQPPHSRAASPAGARTSKAGDTSSIHSRKSSNSVTSWTVKLFAGNSQSKDALAVSNGDRSRASSLGEDRIKNSSKVAPNNTGKNGLSAVAALKRINSYSGANGQPTTTPSSGLNRLGQRRITGSNVPQVPSTDRSISGTAATNLGPVEMDAILPMESRPPALSDYRINYQSGSY